MICVRDQRMRGWKILLCSCMLKDSNLISKADAANGDKVRIVITSATGKGKNLGPTGLREPFSRAAHSTLVSISAVMQELRNRCGLATRTSSRVDARPTEQRLKVGLGQKVDEEARACEKRACLQSVNTGQPTLTQASPFPSL